MNQLSFIPIESSLKPTAKQHAWRLFVDGAARNNPGPAGAGLYIEKDGEPFLKKGFYLGKKTNNQAEYMALLLGIFFIKQHIHEHDTLLIVSDSQLLVRQLQGLYRIKNQDLVALYQCATRLLDRMKYGVDHVLREHNKVADAMANEGIDKKIPVPQDFFTICSF